jgi:hypothetical protein
MELADDTARATHGNFPTSGSRRLLDKIISASWKTDSLPSSKLNLGVEATTARYWTL